MKADYLRYIFECLQGDNGLLHKDWTKQSFEEAIELREAAEINFSSVDDDTTCDMCDPIYYSGSMRETYRG